DGEQSPGASMSLGEKMKIANVLDEMGVDIIEAGFPAASNGDFEAVTEIAKSAKKATIAGLARAVPRDIERAAAAVKHAEKARIHTFISTSPLHMKYKLQMEPEQVLEAVVASVTQARGHVEDVEWSAEDGSRTDPDFLCRCVEAAIKAGATTINIPDTVGYAVPEEFAAIFTMLLERVPGCDEIILSTHCHNDLGLAVANSLAAVKAGARQIECTINGLGERAGNAALEEAVMAIRTRPDFLPYQTQIDTTQITRASRMVAGATGFTIQPNKAIVGANAFAHESGIHQDGMLKNAETYEIMTPESVGLVKSSLVMGKHSGRAAFRAKLEELGFGDIGDNAFQDAFQRMKDLADKKKDIYDEDIVALVDDELAAENETIKFVSLGVMAGSIGPQSAHIVLSVDGDVKTAQVGGSGPVDAIFNGICELVPHEAELQLYQVHAVTGGTDAQAEVTVKLSENGKMVVGQGAHHDTLVASARAYIHALNKLLVKRNRTKPEVISA
ncbi:MAG: 2-isopropylmalate synthase, partial [Pseudomonadota bacterium]